MKIFSGEDFYFDSRYEKKANAVDQAKYLRRKGNKARIFKHKLHGKVMYEVYKRHTGRG